MQQNVVIDVIMVHFCSHCTELIVTVPCSNLSVHYDVIHLPLVEIEPTTLFRNLIESVTYLARLEA